RGRAAGSRPAVALLSGRAVPALRAGRRSRRRRQHHRHPHPRRQRRHPERPRQSGAAMKERWREPMAMVRIRRGGAADAAFVREVAELVFAELGDYGRILPTWLVHDGVLTHIAEEDGIPVGYTML